MTNKFIPLEYLQVRFVLSLSVPAGKRKYVQQRTDNTLDDWNEMSVHFSPSPGLLSPTLDFVYGCLYPRAEEGSEPSHQYAVERDSEQRIDDADGLPLVRRGREVAVTLQGYGKTCVLQMGTGKEFAFLSPIVVTAVNEKKTEL